MTTYKTRDLVSLFDVSGETIRTWATEFVQYLSPTASPGPGRQRIFTDDDVRVLALVAALKSEGKVYDDIHAALKAGQRGDLEQFFVEQATEIEQGGQLAFARHQMSQLRLERDEAVEQQREMRDELIRLRTQLEMMKDQTDQIAALHQKIGRLEALLEIEREKKKTG